MPGPKGEFEPMANGAVKDFLCRIQLVRGAQDQRNQQRLLFAR